jgi:hypothetical protein
MFGPGPDFYYSSYWLALAIPFWGQKSDAFKTQDPGKGFVEIGRNRHFHSGDDLAWAQPA